MLKSKIISSLEKVFLDESFDKYNALQRISALRGERLSVQLLYTYVTAEGDDIYFTRDLATPNLTGELAAYVTLYNVESVPVIKPVSPGLFDENYLRTTPGLYPDVLSPLKNDGKISIMNGAIHTLHSLWIEINVPVDAPVGESELKVSVTDANGEIITESSVTIEVIGATIPEQKLVFTQWFYCDTLAEHYNVPVWSEEHWKIIESFAKTAAKNGINLLLTPVFTPPLDTARGGERLTTQLVSVKRTGNRYTFGYKLLDRWIDMCNRVGIKYFEISHLFTQWGAEHAPKIMATVDGEYKRIFGWDTDAHSEEYKKFLRAFLKSFIKHMKERGDDKRCYYHVSDEPNIKHLENYKKSKRIIAPLLKDYPIMDALSSYDFYKKGVVDHPIPASNHITPFIEGEVKDLWVYYCISQPLKVSNRFISMPSYRTRSIGYQMYKYDIAGFLQWGYNFYHNQFSRNYVNPYIDLSGEGWAPAGDTHSVYPGQGGEAVQSLRLLVFYDAITDMRALSLCESLYSKEEVVAAMEEELGFEVTFDTCANSADQILRMRERINAMIKAKI